MSFLGYGRDGVEYYILFCLSCTSKMFDNKGKDVSVIKTCILDYQDILGFTYQVEALVI